MTDGLNASACERKKKKLEEVFNFHSSQRDDSRQLTAHLLSLLRPADAAAAAAVLGGGCLPVCDCKMFVRI